MLQTYRVKRLNGLGLPLELRALAIAHIQEPATRPNGIELHQWRLCQRGEGELILGEHRYRLAQGIGFFLPQGLPHAYKGLSEDFEMDAFGFSGEAAAAILRSLGVGEAGVYRFEDPARFRRSLESLRRLMTDHLENRDLRASTALYSLLLQTLRTTRVLRDPLEYAARFRSGFIPEMIGYMEEHCELPLSLDDMADRFGRSKEYICTVFKRETGITYVDFLTRVRIFRARRLLLDHPEMKVAEVAARCGFASASYFGLVFKKDVGMSPGLFRRSGR